MIGDRPIDIAGHKDIEIAILIEIDLNTARLPLRFIFTACNRSLQKAAIPLVKQQIGLSKTRDQDVFKAVLVGVTHGNSLGESRSIRRREFRDVCEPSSVEISKELIDVG